MPRRAGCETPEETRMSQIGQAARIAAETLQVAEELRWLHRAIAERDLPFPLRDDFHEQCEAIERAVGGDGYRTARRRARALNVLSLVLALPVLLAVVGFIAYDRLVPGADPLAALFDDMAVFWSVVAVAAVLVGAVLACALAHRAANRRLLGTAYPALLARAGLR